ncbi:MAG: carbon starvation protein A [Bacteroidales bacterium]|nr:carbon starvation protein A [Bacteroidales bacterium]MBR0292511.1 carbon starvation protein A [Bacteroidales bacterium]
MYSFIISIVALVVGYFIYGRVVEKIFGADPARVTPAVSMQDGVDYVPMPSWKVYMIQFLNIAGTGPIFGAIMGAKFGPSCYLWIVLGSIFAGAVHDYFSGMLSMRKGGATYPEIIGSEIKGSRLVIVLFTTFLLLMVGTVFVYSPALILGDIAGDGTSRWILIWAIIILVYYIIATLLPIDKLIGRIYPIFAIALLFMAVAMMFGLFAKWPSIPEFWDGLQNRAPSVGVKGQNIFPCLFITVACGAVSGFHATQSPLMARCLKNERMGRPIFFGAMITEGVVALIWAAVSSYFFFDGGMQECGLQSASAPQVVTAISKHWLGVVGSILAILGVVAAPITSGDTALRGARLNIAEFLHIKQDKIGNRLLISLPIFAAVGVLLWFNISNEDGFNIIWRYFGLSNQTLAVCFLATITVWLIRKYPLGWQFLIGGIPAVFMFTVCLTFFCVDKTCLGLPLEWTKWFALGWALVSAAVLVWYVLKVRRKALNNR